METIVKNKSSKGKKSFLYYKATVIKTWYWYTEDGDRSMDQSRKAGTICGNLIVIKMGF